MTEEQFRMISQDCPWFNLTDRPLCDGNNGGCNIFLCPMVFWLNVHVEGVENFLRCAEK